MRAPNRFSVPVHMADNGGGPVWVGARRRRGAPPLVGLIVTLLAVFGAVTIGLSVKEGSAARAGGVIDGWASTVSNTARRLAGQAPQAAEKAADRAGAATSRAGDAVRAGAEKTEEALRGAD